MLIFTHCIPIKKVLNLNGKLVCSYRQVEEESWEATDMRRCALPRPCGRDVLSHLLRLSATVSFGHIMDKWVGAEGQMALQEMLPSMTFHLGHK